MKSMTGFGKRESLCQGTMVGVEIRSVNHRFCEMMVRLPKPLSHMELALKEQVKRICERGRIELTVTMNGGGSGTNKTLQVDRAMASRYVQGLRDLQKEFKLSGTVDVNVVAGFRDLFFTSEESAVIKDVPKVVEGLVQRALTDLEKMRKKEGTALQKDLLQRVEIVEGRLHVVQQRIPGALQASVDRLKARVAKLLEGERVNEDRIAQEIAMLAERSDVTEESTRLTSHVAQFRSALKSKDPVGKRLDFLLQEMDGKSIRWDQR
ncbi:MAG: YicC family protein [Nitrospirota bacterium]|nr:YicC family protein [Nitrospirota bacterium]